MKAKIAVFLNSLLLIVAVVAAWVAVGLMVGVAIRVAKFVLEVL